MGSQPFIPSLGSEISPVGVVCQICHELMVQPVQVYPCLHNFCEHCIREHASDAYANWIPLFCCCPACGGLILSCQQNDGHTMIIEWKNCKASDGACLKCLCRDYGTCIFKDLENAFLYQRFDRHDNIVQWRLLHSSLRSSLTRNPFENSPGGRKMSVGYSKNRSGKRAVDSIASDFDEISFMDGASRKTDSLQLQPVCRNKRSPEKYHHHRARGLDRAAASQRWRGLCRSGQPIVICALSAIILLLIILIGVLSRSCEQPNASSRRYYETLPETIAKGIGLKTKSLECPISFPWEKLRIPDMTKPIVYNLLVHPNLTTFTFRGVVEIEVEAIHAATLIVLHAKDLVIENCDVRPRSDWVPDKKSRVSVQNFMLCPKWEQLAIRLNGRTRPGKRYILGIAFRGNFTDDFYGLYRSQYKTKNDQMKYMAVTQFEPTDARAAFPCFDEPQFKAEFKVSIIRSKDHVSLANMPKESTQWFGYFRETTHPVGGIHLFTDAHETFMSAFQDQTFDHLMVDHFNKSVQMSTYVVAFALFDGDMHFRYNLTANNVRVVVYAPEPQIQQTEFAIQVAIDSLNWLESFFKVPYPLPKQSLLAVADFAQGAMENWGLVTFRDRYLLYDPKESSTRSKHIIAEVIMHELSHQWFGNLVTMKWWNDLWLNEGFATFIEDYGVSKIRPEWNAMSQYYADVICNALALDGLASSHSISAIIDDPHDIVEIFDEISYDKAGSMIYMLLQFMGEEKLQAGLHEYLEKFKFSNADSRDLWIMLEKQMPNLHGLGLPSVMDSWTNQVGYPYVKLTVESGRVRAEQMRFLYLTEEREKQSNANLWFIPFSVMTNKNISAVREVWIQRTQSAEFPMDTEGIIWLKGDVGQSGFYRMTYDESNWKALTKQLLTNHTVIPPLDRAGILNDAFAFVKAGLLHLNFSLALVEYLPKEEAEAPWDVGLFHLKYIETLLDDTETYGQFREFARSVLEPVYRKFGWDLATDHQKRLLQVQILTLSCHFNVGDCIDRAKAIFEDWMKTNDSLAPDLRGLVCTMGITHGTKKHWLYVYREYVTTNFYPGEREDYLIALFATRDPWLIWRILADLRELSYRAGVRYATNVTATWSFVIAAYQRANSPQDRIALLGSLAATEDKDCIHSLLDMILNPAMIRPRDIPLVFGRLGANPVAKYITWRFIQSNWNRLVEILGITTSLIGTLLRQAMGSFKREFDYREMAKFFNERELGGSEQAVTQLLETIQINMQWMRYNYGPLTIWLQDWASQRANTTASSIF